MDCKVRGIVDKIIDGRMTVGRISSSGGWRRSIVEERSDFCWGCRGKERKKKGTKLVVEGSVKGWKWKRISMKVEEKRKDKWLALKRS